MERQAAVPRVVGFVEDVDQGGQALATRAELPLRDLRDRSDPPRRGISPHIGIRPRRADTLPCDLLADSLDRVPFATRMEHPCSLEVLAHRSRHSQQVGDHGPGAVRHR